MASGKVPLLLLKTKSQPSDGYEEFFERQGRYAPSFVPVLEHRLKEDQIDQIFEQIKGGALSGVSDSLVRYGGMIFTSQRAVETFAEVVQRLRDAQVDLASLFPASLPFYVVGPATAKGLRTLNLDCRILGEETGNGDALAHFILKDFHSVERNLLFLVGEQRRDIIPNTLQSEELSLGKRIKVEEKVVYETGEMDTFPFAFKSAMSAAKKEVPVRQWVVVFSPTGCRAMLEGLNLLDSKGLANVKDKPNADSRSAKVVTIGPTTQSFLRRKFAFEPDACAPKPSAEGILEAIKDYEQNA